MKLNPDQAPLHSVRPEKYNRASPPPGVTQNRNLRPVALAGLAWAALVMSTVADSPPATHGVTTLAAPYAVSISTEYQVLPILSVGDRVPLSGDSARQFQMVGVPDGLGTYPAGRRHAVVYMNHEIAGNLTSEPVVGAPLYRGAFVSKYVLNRDAEVVCGGLGYDVIIDPAGNRLPPARLDNVTPAFWRFCSGSLAWRDAGFDRPIYLCGEESPAPTTFDGKGGLAVAIFDQELHTLPHLGHFQHENLPVRPHPSPETILLLLEDNAGPASAPYQAQLYLYVGRKDPRRADDPLVRNGLVGGRFYVFVSATPGVNSEALFQSGSITGNWVEIEGVADLDEAQLEAASQTARAFGFVKLEDGAWSKRDRNEFFFNSTGDTLNSAVAGNHLGRTYRLKLDSRTVTGPAVLTLIYNADERIRGGQDIALTPDNIGVSRNYLMVCEDGTGFSRTVMGDLGRDGQIWRYDLRNNFAAEPVVRLLPPGRDGRPVGPGVWETSGILETAKLFGRDTWLFDVQAHPPTVTPSSNTLEDGQLLLLVPTGSPDHGNEDEEEEEDRDSWGDE